MASDNGPVREYRMILDDSGNPRYVNRLLVATPTTGLVRMEWVAARYGQIIPCNWSLVAINHFMHGYIPMRYQVADAQNLIVKAAVEGDFEWLLLIEHDTIPPADAFVRFNEYMRDATVPVVSGLYFTKSLPSEPLVYRGRGVSFYGDWHLGDLVWCDGVPTGMLLIHCAILREMWEDAEEYELGHQVTRRVFDAPRVTWFDSSAWEFYSLAGTSDLNWCKQVMAGDYMRKAGWGDFVDNLEDPRYPFLVDTNIFCFHIDPEGIQYPTRAEMRQWQLEEKPKPPTLGISVSDQVVMSDKLR
jgi:hypothetical protein